MSFSLLSLSLSLSLSKPFCWWPSLPPPLLFRASCFLPSQLRSFFFQAHETGTSRSKKWIKKHTLKNSAGRASGAADGAAAGLETGFGLGREVGVYAGAAAAWEKLLLSSSRSGKGGNENEEKAGIGGEEPTSLRRRRAALASVRSLAAAVASFKDTPRDEALSDALGALRGKWRVACASAVAAAGVRVDGIGGGADSGAAASAAAAATTFEVTAEGIRGAEGKVDAPSPSALPSLDF